MKHRSLQSRRFIAFAIAAWISSLPLLYVAMTWIAGIAASLSISD